jgi:hypothetical protein
MDPSYRKVRIEFLREEVEFRRLTCESLARKFERQPLTSQEKSELLHTWEDLLKESNVLQAMLDLLEREDRDALLSAASGCTWFYHAKDRTPMA